MARVKVEDIQVYGMRETREFNSTMKTKVNIDETP